MRHSLKSAPIFAGLCLLAACSGGKPAAHQEGSHDVAAAAAASDCVASPDGAVTAKAASVREQLDASSMSAAYFTVCNGGEKPITLEDLSTPAAGVVEFHETTRDAEGHVSMSAIGPLSLQPGEEVTLMPGGKHAMLMSLQQALKAGETVPLTLHFSDGSEVSVDAPVKSPTEMATHAQH